MKTVAEVFAITGVSIRTLHHYDAIGLLRPTAVTEAGYRLYDTRALQRLHTILLLRELRFPLKEIAAILDSPGFDPVQALEDQIRLLELQRQHLDDLIAHAKQLQKTGGISMSFSAFDNSRQAKYAAEAKKKWGSTNAWKEYEEKSKDRTEDQTRSAGEGLMEIFTRIGTVKDTDPAGPQAQALIRELQAYITKHFYTCTPQILAGLGQMYAAGGEMTENIDKAGGRGTAEFACKAIQVFCRK